MHVPSDSDHRRRRSPLDMDKKVYEVFKSDDVTDEMLDEAAKLFSENYGVWGEHAAERMGKFAKAGRHSLLHIARAYKLSIAIRSSRSAKQGEASK